MKITKCERLCVIFLLALILLPLVSISVNASEMAYSNLSLSGTKPAYTEFLKNNSENNADFFVWLKEPFLRRRYVARCELFNSNFDSRSEEILTYEGTTNTGYTITSKYYDYCLRLLRQYPGDGVAYFSGTWGWIY